MGAVKDRTALITLRAINPYDSPYQPIHPTAAKENAFLSYPGWWGEGSENDYFIS